MSLSRYVWAGSESPRRRDEVEKLSATDWFLCLFAAVRPTMAKATSGPPVEAEETGDGE
jgi:hypothetical protein